MKNQNESQTIVAIATAVGTGSIAVIRMSGSDALSIAKTICNGNEFNKKVEERKMYLCNINKETAKDEVMVVYFKKPFSFTGEDVVEIQCHGNFFLSTKIVEEIIKKGARQAEAGEFSKRAFLNGKIDLTKAEGIYDIINAKSSKEISSAYEYLNGSLYNKLEKIQNELIELIAKGEVAIDYPEEDIEEITKNDIEKKLKDIIKELKEMQKSYESGRIKRDGVKVAIVGKPNVGKSQLLNTILGTDRSIVTSEAGTTRDTIEESYSFNGIRFNFIDTAGIRDAKNKVEKIGINKSNSAILSSDIVLALTDINEVFSIDLPKDKQIIYIINKVDLYKKNGKKIDGNFTKNNKEFESFYKDKKVIEISAKENFNIEKIKEELYKIVVEKMGVYDTTINNTRHLRAVIDTLTSLERGLNGLYNITLDCSLAEFNDAYRYLGSITGIIASDKIVNEIFEKFCVGK